jgi:hypothetical protein
MDDPLTEQDYDRIQESALTELKSISQRLTKIGTIVGILTIWHLALLVLCLLMLSNIFIEASYYYKASLGNLFIVLDIATVLLVIITLYSHDRLAQRGQLIYQEISDEIEWNPSKSISKHINLKFRIILREFVLSTTLPFYRSGRNAAILYLGINALMSVVLWLASIDAVWKRHL